MTLSQKKDLIEQITQLLNKLIEVDVAEVTPTSLPVVDRPMEMLTIKECASLVDGLSEHTVRQLVLQGKVVAVRAGAGRNGKILVNKASLLKYLGIA